MLRPHRTILWLLIALFAALPLYAATAQTDDESAIYALVEAMARAVEQQDREAYLSYVELSDPIFASEHTYWVDDWANGEPLDRFQMLASHVEVDGDTATADLQVKWAVLPDTSYRRAGYPVRFVRDAEGGWLFAGEAWETVETGQFIVHAFPGMEEAVDTLVEALPGIYEHATSSLDHTPKTRVEIKLYDTRDNLGATIALSLPPISGWNEPGESLKMLVEEGNAPSSAVLAHELTHYLTFDMANTSYGHYPWWLAEGISEYIASEYWDQARLDDRMTIVRTLFAQGEQAEWDLISDYETTPVELWRYVYPQGYVFARYVTETYGADDRNAWLWQMAGDADLDAASQAVFGVSFEALDQDFRAWLAES